MVPEAAVPRFWFWGRQDHRECLVDWKLSEARRVETPHNLYLKSAVGFALRWQLSAGGFPSQTPRLCERHLRFWIFCFWRRRRFPGRALLSRGFLPPEQLVGEDVGHAKCSSHVRCLQEVSVHLTRAGPGS